MINWTLFSSQEVVQKMANTFPKNPSDNALSTWASSWITICVYISYYLTKDSDNAQVEDFCDEVQKHVIKLRNLRKEI
jgi:hypothetical protein